MIGRRKEADTLLQAVGFRWDAEFEERFQLYFDALNGSWKTLSLEAQKTSMRLLIFLSSPEGSIDHAEVSEWIPAPKEIAEVHSGNPWYRNAFTVDITYLGAQAFLKLGRDDDACEVARIALSAEPKIEKKWVLLNCHCVLGQVAAKRGNLDEADSHFANALEEVKLSGLPMLEVLVARDWKKFLLEPNGRDASAAEAAIDGACAAMNKTRADVASVFAEG